ncbi:DNA polymerase family A-domain-containing protein [Limtongia smithiae]|uniref:DNA polymerase family A-domain-containing protein n=1 Tax=Limtongia smithiae TaxID=1125753 RepID=UPI0034CEBE1F
MASGYGCVLLDKWGIATSLSKERSLLQLLRAAPIPEIFPQDEVNHVASDLDSFQGVSKILSLPSLFPLTDSEVDKLAPSSGQHKSRKHAHRSKKNVEVDLLAAAKKAKNAYFAKLTKQQKEALEFTPPADESGEKRFNEVGIQQLSKLLHKQLFPKGATEPFSDLVKLSKLHLHKHSLLGKQADIQPSINLDLPPLEGDSLDAHFFRLGTHVAEPFLSISKEFSTLETAPEMPKTWVIRSGWTKYVPGKNPSKVGYPDGDCLVFDVETLYKESPFAVMATAMSKDAWFCWISPWLLEETKTDRHLVPLATHSSKKVIIGHNVGYDRVRVKEEYNYRLSKAMFLDTMSLHIATNGMCSQQRPTWMKLKKQEDSKAQLKLEDNQDDEMTSPVIDEADIQGKLDELKTQLSDEPWVAKSSVNNLAEVAKFHCGITVDKSDRDYFGTLDRAGVRDMIQQLITYCARDVHTTFMVYRKVLPAFLKVCPHPVSFAGMKHLSSVFLPIDKSWDKYIESAEGTYQSLLSEVENRLTSLIEDAVKLKDTPEKYESDPWLRQLDWTVKEIRMTKPKKKGEEPRLAKNQKMPGYPEWYKSLFPKAGAPMNVSVRTRIAPLILRLSWDGNPLVWSDTFGWTFRVPAANADKYNENNNTFCPMSMEKPLLSSDTEGAYFKIPHKDGPLARCASPLAKGYTQHFESGILASEYPYAREALDMNASCSYWISARERISSQLAIWKEDVNMAPPSVASSDRGLGMIIPTLIPMGTITRRAVESTWLTASNAKKNRIGSELKAMIRAPEGYKFVGADVDSEELWIASLVGDSQFGLHGGTAIGWMTLEGTKSMGTDLHSKTASILDISRNNAKVFNYGRIYGAGLKFAIQLLRQFNPSISEDEAKRVATKLYESTKGGKSDKKRSNKFRRGPFWFGGTESLMFNKLEEIANQEIPRTPVLGCAITQALMQANLKNSMFMTSRINWAIQSSGVDYLHLLIVSMEYLIEKYKLDARLCITVHDEIRYLVKDKARYKVALALQISNLWTRAMFCEQMGIHDIPQSCAFFSAVDIDTVIRKEVDVPCVTPSHPDAIPAGESLDIMQLLSKPTVKLKEKQHIDLSQIEYKRRIPVFEQMAQHQQLLVDQLKEEAPVPSNDLAYLSAQISDTGKPFYQ